MTCRLTTKITKISPHENYPLYGMCDCHIEICHIKINSNTAMRYIAPALSPRGPAAFYNYYYENFREKPFLLPHVLGYLGLPDPTKWKFPADWNVVVGLIKIARYLQTTTLIEHIASILEVPPRALDGTRLCKLVRSKIRFVCVHVCSIWENLPFSTCHHPASGKTYHR